MKTIMHGRLPILLILAIFGSSATLASDGKNIIPNGDFSSGKAGGIPDGWNTELKYPSAAAVFSKYGGNGKPGLMIRGAGQSDLVEGIKTRTRVNFGKTYLFWVRFKIYGDINPDRNLLFQCYGPQNFDGIFDYEKKDSGWVEGRAKIFFPGSGAGDAEIRIMFRFSKYGKVLVNSIHLEESKPDPPRWVRVTCTSGFTSPGTISKIARYAAAQKSDLLLLPEFMIGSDKIESLDGVSATLMSSLSRTYHMYIAGGILRKDAERHRVFNTTLLYDREGRLIAMYDKIHPSSPEVNEMGVTPGRRVVTVATDFGRIGFMTCYDSWFTDVAELNALRGAELLLFPNAGYYRSIMTARATDNGIRIVASSLYNRGGVWDTGGRDVLNPDADSTAMMLPGKTFDSVRVDRIDSIEVISASLDLNFSPHPAHNNGWMYSAPGGRRSKREQLYYLDNDIQKERARWWKQH
jgi:predicted amidohydrolase